jgi:hypothetical protein
MFNYMTVLIDLNKYNIPYKPYKFGDAGFIVVMKNNEGNIVKCDCPCHNANNTHFVQCCAIPNENNVVDLMPWMVHKDKN